MSTRPGPTAMSCAEQSSSPLDPIGKPCLTLIGCAATGAAHKPATAASAAAARISLIAIAASAAFTLRPRPIATAIAGLIAIVAAPRANVAAAGHRLLDQLIGIEDAVFVELLVDVDDHRRTAVVAGIVDRLGHLALGRRLARLLLRRTRWWRRGR